MDAANVLQPAIEIQPGPAPSQPPQPQALPAARAAKARSDVLDRESGRLYGVGPQAPAQPEALLHDVTLHGARQVGPLCDAATQLAGSSGATNACKYEALHCEFLLDRCVEFLNAALIDQQRYNETTAKAFQLSLELKEFLRLDALHEKERAAGAYEVPAYTASSEVAATAAAKTSLEDARTTFTAGRSYALNRTDHERILRQMLAFASAFPTTQREASEARVQMSKIDLPKSTNFFNDLDFIEPQRKGMIEARLKLPPGSLASATVESDSIPQSPKPEFIQQITARLTEADLVLRNTALAAQDLQIGASIVGAENRLFGLQKAAEWAVKNRDFQSEKLSIARELNDEKQRAVTMAGGALNYAERLEYDRARFQFNLGKGLELALAAREGLGLVYGYTDNFSEDQNQASFFSRLWIWAQAAKDFVSRISEASQSVVFQLSLKDLNANVTRGTDGQQRWNFDIPENRFFDLRCLRLRGLSVYPMGRNIAGAWTGYIVPPKSLRFLHPGGGEGSREQPAPRPVYFGRASSWDPVRVPDVFGIVPLHNVSPLGKWEIGLRGNSSAGTPLDAIDDLAIDLHVAAI
jgi:hypothetical protein